MVHALSSPLYEISQMIGVGYLKKQPAWVVPDEFGRSFQSWINMPSISGYGSLNLGDVLFAPRMGQYFR